MKHINSICPICGRKFENKADLSFHLPCKNGKVKKVKKVKK